MTTMTRHRAETLLSTEGSPRIPNAAYAGTPGRLWSAIFKSCISPQDFDRSAHQPGLASKLERGWWPTDGETIGHGNVTGETLHRFVLGTVHHVRTVLEQREQEARRARELAPATKHELEQLRQAYAELRELVDERFALLSAQIHDLMAAEQ